MQLYGKEVINPLTYIDYWSQLRSVHKAIVVSVIHLKRPAQFMLQVSPENQVQRCHELEEVDRVVLRNQDKWRWGLVPTRPADLTASISHPVFVKGPEHSLCVLCRFPGWFHSKETLELVQKKLSAWALCHKFLVHVLKRANVDFLAVLRLLSLPHGFLCLSFTCPSSCSWYQVWTELRSPGHYIYKRLWNPKPRGRSWRGRLVWQRDYEGINFLGFPLS